MTVHSLWPPAHDGGGRSWKESIKNGSHQFSGDLDDVDGSLTVSRRPMMDAYCTFFLGGSARRKIMQDLRKEAEERTGEMYIRQGFNAVYHEEFEFFVDKFTWEKYFGRWGESKKLRWPWPTSVNNLKAGGLSLTYDRLLQASRQDRPSLSLSKHKAATSQPNQLRPPSRKRARTATSSERGGGSDAGSGQMNPAVDLVPQATYREFEERFASLNARLLQVEAYPQDGRPSLFQPSTPPVSEDVRRSPYDEDYRRHMEHLIEVEKRRKESAN